ncbi:MAG: DNA mismatch repair endonuclease MutL [candidate division Zixibacteria bacterium]|nr:DNA mismatch repair endonuclease MutL [candidate division Zixibacteria bacterium]
MSDFKDNKFQRPIRQLDRNLINKIAAGEVVERPASVIKEMMENAFDAGATRVDVVAQKSGTTYISVIDNGCGIRSDQIELAFSRHATSKISNVDDLFAVNSYGFRGEALPSIASVSHLTLTTRHYSEDQGTKIVIEGGRQIERKPVSAPVGTKVEISHLFFNTPARRKFLKAESTESRQIIRVAERMALGKPSVAVSLNLNKRQVFQLPANRPITERMAALFGVKSDGIVEYDVELSGVSYLVYLAHPDLARHDRTRICLFVNGRSVASSSIIHAVTSGYGEFLPGGRFPLAAIYIAVVPDRLDVNVHPTKAEVRLSEERAIHDNLYRIVKKALRDWRMVPGSEQAPGGHPMTGYRSGGNAPGPSSNYPQSSQTLFNQNRTGPSPSMSMSSFSLPAINRTNSEIPIECDNSQPIAEDKLKMSSEGTIQSETLNETDIQYLGKSGRLYLLLAIRGELFVVDQHAAHERVLYESSLKKVENGSGLSQKILFPETIELSAEEYLAFEASREVLSKLGFDAEPFGQNTVIVNGMPPVFKDKSPSRILRKMLDDIGVLNKAGGDLIKSVAQSVACRAAVMAGDRLSSEEVISLVIKLFSMNNPYCCPHGRPTFIKISIEELDSRFGR